MWRYRFAPISLFPKFPLSDILQIERILAKYSKIPPDNSRDFMTVLFWYEKEIEERKRQEQDSKRSKGGINPSSFE